MTTENTLGIGGKVKTIMLNGRRVTVIMPKEKISYEEGVRRIEKLIKKIKKEAGIKD